jgi:hypothetical protein
MQARTDRRIGPGAAFRKPYFGCAGHPRMSCHVGTGASPATTAHRGFVAVRSAD